VILALMRTKALNRQRSAKTKPTRPDTERSARLRVETSPGKKVPLSAQDTGISSRKPRNSLITVTLYDPIRFPATSKENEQAAQQRAVPSAARIPVDMPCPPVDGRI
jgi:hypothetical protein